MGRIISGIFLFFIVFTGCKENEQLTIYTIGDSTMANKKTSVFPETGWCQVLNQYFDESVKIENYAVNGRSSKSFIDEGKWQLVLDSLKKGNYIFIQFGHNDQKEYDSTRYTSPFGSYTNNLKRFINESRLEGAKPILFTSIVRRHFDESGVLIDTHGKYPEATRNVAKEMDVPLIDLQKLTENWINKLGEEKSKELFVWTAPDNNFPEGRKDNTHLSEKGANMVAQIALKECINQNLEFSKKIK